MFMKRAVRRAEGYPVGQAAPMYLDCVCGRRVDLPDVPNAVISCADCSLVYDSRGWILERS